MRPLAVVSFRQATGRDGSARANGALATAGFHTLTPACLDRAGACGGAEAAKLGSDATGAGPAGGGSCWSEGVV